MIMRTTWKPASTPDAGIRPEYQVSTNGRGAVVYLMPPGSVPDTRPSAGVGGVMAFTPRPPKSMMDPSDRATWQRPYRFT